jgi:hypothetical protein
VSSRLLGQRLEPGEVGADGGDHLVPDPSVDAAADGPLGHPIVHLQAQLGCALDRPEPGGGRAGDQPEQLLEALNMKMGWLRPSTSAAIVKGHR